MIKESGDLVGKSWVTKNGSTIFVYDRIKGSRTEGKKYLLACSKCSSDRELFPEIIMHRTGVRDNVTPCGCSSKIMYSGKQQRVMASRKAIDLGVEFIGFDGDFCGNRTKVLTYCRAHGNKNSAVITSFLSRVTCCSYSAIRESLKARILSEEEFRVRAISTGKFNPGTTFKRVGLTNNWDVFCPKCQSDEYAASGIPSIWRAVGASILLGSVQCRCSSRHAWTKEEYEKRIELSGVIFGGWEGEYIGNSHKDRFIAICDKHGNRSVSVSAAINGRGCPGCAKTGFDTSGIAYLYCLVSDDGALMKIGITKKRRERFSRLKRKTPFDFSYFGAIQMIGALAWKEEKRIHSILMSAELSGFEGASEWFRFDQSILEAFK